MKLPLASLGIGWIIPAAIGLVVGLSPLGKAIGKKLRNS
jgi:branched-subunit amino acid permease